MLRAQGQTPHFANEGNEFGGRRLAWLLKERGGRAGHARCEGRRVFMVG